MAIAPTARETSRLGGWSVRTAGRFFGKPAGTAAKYTTGGSITALGAGNKSIAGRHEETDIKPEQQHLVSDHWHPDHRRHSDLQLLHGSPRAQYHNRVLNRPLARLGFDRHQPDRCNHFAGAATLSTEQSAAHSIMSELQDQVERWLVVLPELRQHVHRLKLVKKTNVQEISRLCSGNF